MKSFIILITSQLPPSRQIALRKALLNANRPAEYIVSDLFNLRSILSLIDFRLRSILQGQGRQRFLIFIGNNIPYSSVFLRLIFPGSYIIADLGYPITDIPVITLWRRVLYVFSDFFTLFFSSKVLLESTAQVARFSVFFSNFPIIARKFLPLLVYVPFKPQSASCSPPQSFNSLKAFSPYFLFRGRLNRSVLIYCFLHYANFLFYGHVLKNQDLLY